MMDETLPPRQPVGPEFAARSGRRKRSRRPPPEHIGAYRVVEKLGEGGMGAVYKCRDGDLNRWVAIKVLHETYAEDPQYRTRFQREAQTIASLSHSSVAQVHGFGETSDEHGALLYIVMEYLEGKSIEALLREDGALALEDAIRITADTADGLRVALQQGIVHRDIKPSNLLVTSEGQVKILDFGLAKELGGETTITQDGIVLGTPHYISPEQGRGRAVDHRADVYSLGATFYHMVTGKPPFQGEDQVAVIVAHVNDEPLAPHTVDPAIPEDVSRVILRMLAKAPEQRYGRYQDLVADLVAVAGGEELTGSAFDSGTSTAFATPPRNSASGPLPDSAIGRSAIGRSAIGRSAVQAPRGGLAALLLASAVGALLAVGAILLYRHFVESGRHPLSAGDSDIANLLRHQSGRDLLEVDFSREKPEAIEALSRLLQLPRGETSVESNLRLPSPRDGALQWETFAPEFALGPVFKEIDEVHLDVGKTSGRVDLGLSIVDPLGSKRRALRVSLSPGRPMHLSPLEALRHSEPSVTLDDDASRPRDKARPSRAAKAGAPLGKQTAELAPVPRIGTGPFRVSLTFKREGGNTRLDMRIARSPSGEDCYTETCHLEGTDWGSGVLVLDRASVLAKHTVALDGIVVQGRLDRTDDMELVPMETTPWRS